MEAQPTAEPAANPAGDAASSSEAATIANIHQLLRTKDDTKRFVGLAMLKSVLDNSPQLREDQQVVQALWSSISAKFLDRLLKTGSKPSSSNQTAKDMLDLAVSVLHTFIALLPEESRGEVKLTGRIPGLVNALLYRYEGDDSVYGTYSDSALPAPTRRQTRSSRCFTPWPALRTGRMLSCKSRTSLHSPRPPLRTPMPWTSCASRGSIR